MMGQAGNGGLQVQMTGNDQGPLLAIISWVFMTMMVLAVLFRLLVKFGIRGSLKMDDYAVCAALFFGLIQTVLISVGVRDGLGMAKHLLRPDEIENIEKLILAAEILLILATSAAKVSLLALLGQLAVDGSQRWVIYVSLGAVAAWTMTAVFVLGFQCGTSDPWDTQNGQCINKFHFWVGISVVDILTELAVMILPIVMMLPVRVALSKKVAVILAFSFRVGVPILVIVRLVLLHSYFSASDFTLEYVESGVVTQILISLSITTACMPALKPFLDSFQSGALNVEIKRDTSGSYHQGSNYELRSQKQDRNTLIKSGLGSRNEERRGYLDITANADRRERNKNDSVSLWSGKSDDMIIKRTDVWTVESERSSPADPTKVRPSTRTNVEYAEIDEVLC